MGSRALWRRWCEPLEAVGVAEAGAAAAAVAAQGAAHAAAAGAAAAAAGGAAVAAGAAAGVAAAAVRPAAARAWATQELRRGGGRACAVEGCCPTAAERPP
eukprot:12599955-Alexandrium_andersonii.AAC.1